MNLRNVFKGLLVMGVLALVGACNAPGRTSSSPETEKKNESEQKMAQLSDEYLKGTWMLDVEQSAKLEDKKEEEGVRVFGKFGIGIDEKTGKRNTKFVLITFDNGTMTGEEDLGKNEQPAVGSYTIKDDKTIAVTITKGLDGSTVKSDRIIQISTVEENRFVQTLDGKQMVFVRLSDAQVTEVREYISSIAQD